MSVLNSQKFLSEQECSRFEYTLERFKNDSLRDYLVLGLAYRTGARAEEVLSLKVKDVNIYNQSVYITGLKGSLDREIPVDKKFFKELNNFINNKNLDDFVFDIGYHRLRDIWTVWRPVTKKFHSLRHTFAIRLYKKTKDIHLVKSALGHKSINSSMIYLNYCYTQKELRTALL